ncbi:MAG: Nif11-like leader peptide family RiPP precursor [Arenicellales bacterium]
MSKENLDQFIQKVTDDEQLQSRIGEEIDADSLIALGAEHGCEFTADDLTAGAELSDKELDGVAGGAAYIKDAGIGRRGSKFRIGRNKSLNYEEIKIDNG